MYKAIARFVIVLLLLAGCSTKGPSAEKVDQFYSDSETVNELLFQVYSEGRSELTYEEQSTLSDYEQLYGKKSDFYKEIDDSNAHIISSIISYMKLLITAEKPVVTGTDNKEEFYNEYTEVKRYISEVQ